MTDIKTLIFDVETNGMRPKNSGIADEPAITQIAAILFWGRRPVAHLSTFVQPLNFDGSNATIPNEKFFIDAGITQETVDAVGRPLKTGLAEFNQMVKLADRMIAHNIQFDAPIMQSNYLRISAPQGAYLNVPKFCTMKTLEPILKLPGEYGYKYPSLMECYKNLIDPAGFEGAHDAMVDVQACAAVLWAIEDLTADGDPRFENCELWKLP